jgi:hypothetical protein
MPYTPDQGKEVLTRFVELDKASPVVGNYSELQSVISQDVRSALSSLVVNEGRPPVHSHATTLAVLENKHRLTKVQGVAHNNPGSNEPRAVQLGRYRWPYHFGISRTQYAFMNIDDDRPFILADDGDFSYTPDLAAKEAANGDRVLASRILTGYLWTVLDLTKELIQN